MGVKKRSTMQSSRNGEIMPSLKTRLAFLFTGRLPERDKKIDDLKNRADAYYNHVSEVDRDIVTVNGFFWKLYEAVITAQDLNVLVNVTQQLSVQYEKTVGFRYEPSWMYNETAEYGGKPDELRQKHNGNRTEADAE